ncbi:tellurite resistance TerB family protein [Candidatus Stoquefichus sp. SB1]|uniref:tellurite resistance TerB family protein n=1 Tax=Candidatus Stoquefichus sp. SB1 TaxID=1658109 RepID=UPI00067F6B89|nr:tellurite resistance TerB family protein [Candidatus Stoquefichus sp. SB1]
MAKDFESIKEDVKNGIGEIKTQTSKIGSNLVDETKFVIEKSTDVLSKSVEGDGSSLLGKSLLGAAIGVCAVAAAPFTGGGSVLAGATFVGSLASAGAITGATIAGTIGAVGGMAKQGYDNIKKENLIKEAKVHSFKDGINKGKSLTVQQIKKYADFCLATTALSFYIARCDGSIDDEEMIELERDLNLLKKNRDLPEAIKNELLKISREDDLSFEDVKKYLDEVSIETLVELKKDIDEIIEANGVISVEEKYAKNQFLSYLYYREKSENING